VGFEKDLKRVKKNVLFGNGKLSTVERKLKRHEMIERNTEKNRKLREENKA
jgi:hypothetical protein